MLYDDGNLKTICNTEVSNMKSLILYYSYRGKTVIPFCTSASSGIGESGAQLAALAGTGDWQEGQRFPSAVTQQEVTDWVKSLGK